MHDGKASTDRLWEIKTHRYLVEKRGLVLMKSNGKGCFGTTYMITLNKKGCPDFHGEHPVVGRVVTNSMKVLDSIAKCASQDGTPTRKVFIAGSSPLDAYKA